MTVKVPSGVKSAASGAVRKATENVSSADLKKASGAAIAKADVGAKGWVAKGITNGERAADAELQRRVADGETAAKGWVAKKLGGDNALTAAANSLIDKGGAWASSEGEKLIQKGGDKLNTWANQEIDRGAQQATGLADRGADSLKTGTTRPSAPKTRTAQPSQPELAPGARGKAVRDLQEQLKARGFNPGPLDGEFGNRTQAAVRAFQKANHLRADGIVGPKTWAALSAASES